MPSLQDCVSRKVPKLIDEGMSQDQAVAVAYAMCGDKAKQAGLEIIEWEDLSDQQRTWWLATIATLSAADKHSATVTDYTWDFGDGTPSTTIKRLGDNRVGGYLIVWGGPDQRDLEGQWFTPSTYLGKSIGTPRDMMGKSIGVKLPWLFDHMLSELPEEIKQFDDVRDYELGIIDTLKFDSIGAWAEAQEQRHDAWAQAVQKLIDKNILQWSSGSSPGHAKALDSGEITTWPIIEGSSTPVPAEPRHTQIRCIKHYVNQQDDPTMATADEAARGDPDIPTIDISGMTEDESVTLTLNDNTARAVIKAYAAAEFETIKAAVEGYDHVKQGNMIEEALKPLAAQLAEMAGVDEGMALAELVAFVAEHATAGGSESAPPEEMTMSEEPPTMTLSADEQHLQKLVNDAAAKAVQTAMPQSAGGAFRVDNTPNIIVREDRRNMKSIKSLGGMILAMSQGRYDLLMPHQQKTISAHKALGINPDTAGGYLVPVEHSNQIIELLRDTTKVLPLCRTVPMNSDTLEIPRQTGGATAYWVGENSAITASEETFGQIRLVARKLAGLVQVSNELLMDSDPAVDAIIREDLARVLALEVDRVILEGSGLGNQPTGILNLGITQTPLNAVPTFANLSTAVSNVEVANVMEEPTWAWVFNPREKNTFRTLQDGAGRYIFVETGSDFAMVGGVPPQLLGYPFATTTQITPTAGANPETEIYFGQWNDVIVGMRKTLELRVSDEAGTAFQNDQTWVRAIIRMDVNIRHPESIEVLTDVRNA